MPIELSNSDSLTSLEYLLEVFDVTLAKIAETQPEHLRPCVFEELTEPFAGLVGDFTIHKIRFSYMKAAQLINEDSLSCDRRRVVENISSLYWFASLVEQEARKIFVHTEILDTFVWFPSKIKLEKIVAALREIQYTFDYDYFRARIIEGYVGDGKSQLINSVGSFDSELDYLYRAEIKENSHQLKHMPEGFFRVFALLGIYGALCSSIVNKTPFFIDRSWISHEYFASQGKPRYVNDYVMPEISATLNRDFFVNIFSWPRVFRQLDSPLAGFSLTEDIEFYFRQTPIEIPWPFREHRQLEQEVYATKEELIKHYKQFYLMLNKYFLKCTIQTGDMIHMFL